MQNASGCGTRPLVKPASLRYATLTESAWAASPETLTVSQGQVHLWKVQLSQADSELQHLEESLSFDERARAERFFFERDRRRFIAARGHLRIILSRYLRMGPGALVFSYGPRGKPFLTQPLEARTLKFNLSHSGDLGLIAVTQGRDIGVDLEEVHTIEEADQIAARFFSRQENALLRTLPKTQRLTEFFSCWTLKEAYVKAVGDGLSLPTESFDVAFGRGERARLLSVDGKAEEPLRWSLMELVPARGYIGAIAVEGLGWTLSLLAADPVPVARGRK